MLEGVQLSLGEAMLEIIWFIIFVLCAFGMYQAEKWNGKWSFNGIALIFTLAALAIMPFLMRLT
jgi:hypothetical protein